MFSNFMSWNYDIVCLYGHLDKDKCVVHKVTLLIDASVYHVSFTYPSEFLRNKFNLKIDLLSRSGLNVLFCHQYV